MFAKLAMLTLGAAVFRSNDQASVYASFGVNSAVLSGDNIEEHRQSMLSADVDVRDGDDAIILQNDNESGVVVTDRVNDELDTEDRIEIQIPDGPKEVQPENQEDSKEAQTDEQEGDLGEQLGDAPDDLVKATSQIAEYASGLQEMKEQAIANGLTPEAAAKIEAEYEENSELSAESLKALEDAGFKPAFVKSFLQGQESIASAYVSQIIQYAGGQTQWDTLIGHLHSNSPETVEVLEDAMNRQDLKAVKATINLAKASHKAKFGAAPARNVAAKAPAVAAKAAQQTQIEAFKSSDEMVKAMSDRRYATDPAYRAQVRAKVAAM